MLCVSNNCMHAYTAQAAQYDSITLINIVNHQGLKINTRSCMHAMGMNQIILV